MNKINTAFSVGLILLSSLHTAHAATDDTTWDFTWESTDYTSTDGDISKCYTSGCSFGNEFTASAKGTNLTISAWADTGDYTSVETANLSHNEHGLLNYNQTWVQNAEGKWYISDEHTVDNTVNRDMILLSFSEMVQLTSLKIGWGYEWYDGAAQDYSDITVAAFDSLPTLSGNTWSTVASAASYIKSYSNFAIGNFASLGDSTYESQYWLVGTYNKFFSSEGWTSDNDYIKIAGLTTHVSAQDPTETPTTEASAPSTLAILGLAISGLWLRRRNSV